MCNFTMIWKEQILTCTSIWMSKGTCELDFEVGMPETRIPNELKNKYFFFWHGQIAPPNHRFEARKVILWCGGTYKHIRANKNRPSGRLWRSK